MNFRSGLLLLLIYCAISPLIIGGCCYSIAGDSSSSSKSSNINDADSIFRYHATGRVDQTVYKSPVETYIIHKREGRKSSGSAEVTNAATNISSVSSSGNPIRPASSGEIIQQRLNRAYQLNQNQQFEAALTEFRNIQPSVVDVRQRAEIQFMIMQLSQKVDPGRMASENDEFGKIYNQLTSSYESNYYEVSLISEISHALLEQEGLTQIRRED